MYILSSGFSKHPVTPTEDPGSLLSSPIKLQGLSENGSRIISCVFPFSNATLISGTLDLEYPDIVNRGIPENKNNLFLHGRNRIRVTFGYVLIYKL